MLTENLDNNLKNIVNLGRPWYLKGLGFFGFLVICFLIILGGHFVNKVQYYVSAFNDNDFSKLKGYFIDAREYAPHGTQVSRMEVETFDDPYYGPKDAKVVLVEFGDFQCPFCKENAPDLAKLRKNYGDRVKFIWRDFPLTYSHPQALIAAKAASCANDQNAFWEYHDVLFENQNNFEDELALIGYATDLGLDEKVFTSCIDSSKYEIEAKNDLQDGTTFSVRGTPTYFINGVRLSGVLSYEMLSAVLDKFLEK